MFADVTDPWAYIGATRFERAAAMFSILTGEPIEMTFRAHQVEPDEPSDGRLLLEAMTERLGDRDKVDLVATSELFLHRIEQQTPVARLVRPDLVRAIRELDRLAGQDREHRRRPLEPGRSDVGPGIRHVGEHDDLHWHHAT